MYLHIFNIVKKIKGKQTNMKNNNDVAMFWRMMWLNRSVTIINVTLQLLDTY